MKNKKILFLLIAIFAFLIAPFFVNAQEKVVIYFFRGEGCPHCADAEEFFETLKNDDEYKDKFEIKDYEVWHNDSNQKLAEKVAKAMGDSLNGVPYIVIGEKTWSGFIDSYGDEMKSLITELYSEGEYHDPVLDVLEGKSNSTVTIIIIVLVIIAALVGLYFARKDSEEIAVSDEDEEEKVEKKEVEEEESDEKVTETYKPIKNTQKNHKKTQNKKNKR